MTTPQTHPITFSDLTWRYPDLDAIFRLAEQTRDWRRLSTLRADIRAIGMDATDEAVALGLLGCYEPMVEEGRAA